MNDSDIQLEPLHYSVARPIEEPLAPMVEVNADGQICAAEGATDVVREGSPRALEHSIGQIDPRAPGWKRRGRRGLRTHGRAVVNALLSSGCCGPRPMAST